MMDLDEADQVCQGDLTSQLWTGKEDAMGRGLLQPGSVRAFLCRTQECRQLEPNTAYRFAVASRDDGGAGFVTDEMGRGPNDRLSWTRDGAFGDSGLEPGAQFWTGRAGGPSPATWPDTAVDTCDTTGRSIGTANAITADRWASATVSCDGQARLVCIVSPYPAP
jgi:hypothetical protein